MNRSLSFTAVFLGIASVSSDLCSAQDGGITPGATRNNDPVVFTTAQDRQNMLDQLGITKLRPYLLDICLTGYTRSTLV
jgi:hypothetical protein